MSSHSPRWRRSQAKTPDRWFVAHGQWAQAGVNDTLQRSVRCDPSALSCLLLSALLEQVEFHFLWSGILFR